MDLPKTRLQLQTWHLVISSNLYSQIIKCSSGVFNFWTTNSPFWYGTHLKWSQKTLIYFFWKVLNFLKTIKLTSTVLVFDAFEAEREKMAEINSICTPVIPVCVFKEFRSQGWLLDASTQKIMFLTRVSQSITKSQTAAVFGFDYLFLIKWFLNVMNFPACCVQTHREQSKLFSAKQLIKNCCCMFFRKLICVQT